MVKNRMTYGVVVVVLLLFIYLYESPMTYMAIYAVLFLPLLSFLFALFSKRRLLISERLTTDIITKSQKTSFLIVIHNRYFLPCISVRIQFLADEVGLTVSEREKFVSLPSFGQREFEFEIQGKYRGEYEVGVTELILHDFLGLFRFKQKHTEKLNLVVTPRILPISALPLDTIIQETVISRRNLQGDDYSSISELRKYQPTDGYKKVHWKATAKRNELISKNFQATERMATTFFVDNTIMGNSVEDKMAQEDLLMEAVVSVMYHCYRLGQPMSFHYIGDGFADFTTDFTYLYKKASGLKFQQGNLFKKVLRDYLKWSKDEMNLLVFTHRVDEEMLSLLQAFRLSGNQVQMFLFSRVSEGILRSLERLEIYFVYFDEIVLSPEKKGSTR